MIDRESLTEMLTTIRQSGRSCFPATSDCSGPVTLGAVGNLIKNLDETLTEIDREQSEGQCTIEWTLFSIGLVEMDRRTIIQLCIRGTALDQMPEPQP